MVSASLGTDVNLFTIRYFFHSPIKEELRVILEHGVVYRPAQQDERQGVEQRTTAGGWPLFLFDDRFVCTPPSFVLNRKKMKVATAWDLWWAIGYQFMPLRAIIHSDNYRPQLYHGRNEHQRSNIKRSVLELKVVMGFVEQHGPDDDLARLIELVSDHAASRDVVAVRTLAKAVWEPAWEAIMQRYTFNPRRMHDTPRCA
eukprot:CAMPEP_0177657538 /NCGR_PEP_ID=MMETSP0447-20121125/16251_1 /TAXON_ID=0 /ORGANISM="Stygamoeba regulata, Strain BSH-02190019" /LENGTH=199 /DNA_ID=CAMNT_0019161925 /DNA_START=307 /DNA_END=903 /DNA_ORIENTATION=-